MDLKTEISKILIPTDYHTEDHQNIPITSWSYTREGINFVVNQLLTLIKKHEREVIEDVKRIKLDMDTIVCDCGEPYKGTDPSNLVNDLLAKLKEVEK